MNAIRKANLRLGISTHNYIEVARAHTFRPSYLACGPIFPTTSKIMPFSPQGLQRLHRWRRTLQYPLVAIGGINADNLPAILSCAVDGVALISAITQANDPIAATNRLLTMVNENAAGTG
jgi:hydroxymethylpyrimidine kinase/phosphomethylpyrimidine kinase/thiamine-phosphate diphosphorylase